MLTGKFSFDMLSGPVGIAVSTHKVAQSGVYYLMKWGAILSINLGIINLLPLPALDGGRLTFLRLKRCVENRLIVKRRHCTLYRFCPSYVAYACCYME